MTGLLWFGAGFLAGSILFDQLWRAHRRIAKRIAALSTPTKASAVDDPEAAKGGE